MMEEEFLMFKNYVASPGIVEIRWKCDDPTQFRPPEDLFERQSMGMPEDFGKKDPLSTFQPVLYCMVCETEMSSIKTLELHTKGTDHQKNVQHKINSERLQNNWIRPTAVPGNLEAQWNAYNPAAGRPLYGRKFVIMYVEDKRSMNLPIYFCGLKECGAFRGNTMDFIRHVCTDKHRDAALSKGSMESKPLTVIINPRDFNEAKQNKIPESFWPTQDKVLPRVEREPAHPRVDPLPTPMEEELSPRYAPSTVAGPSRVTDLHSDPNIEKFDQMLEDFLKKSLNYRVERGDISHDAAQRLFSELYPPIKRHFKTEHLMKGEPMETIRFEEKMGSDVDGMIETKLIPDDS